MAFALIDSTQSSGSGVASSSIDSTGADLLIAVISVFNQVPSSSAVTDSKGNTFTQLTPQSDVVSCCVYYCLNPTVGSGHTFTTTDNFPSGTYYAFSGANTSSSFDQQNGTHPGGASTGQPGSVTPSENNELLITGIGFGSTNTPSVDSGFTIGEIAPDVPATAVPCASAYLIQTTAAASNPTWSITGSNIYSVVIATFKAAAGGGTPTVASTNMGTLLTLGVG